MLFHSAKKKVDVNFLLIGAQKCGTSWLSAMICQHPEVSDITTKEIHYFNNPKNYKKGESWYSRHFSITHSTKIVGEYTPNYFWTYDNNIDNYQEVEFHDSIPELVYKYNPKMKLILILRDPVNRAISAFFHHIRQGRIHPKFKLIDSLDNFGIFSMGQYNIHLNNWLKYFPIESFLILIYENDLTDINKSNTIKKVYIHLNIDPNFNPKGIFNKYNSKDNCYEIRLKYHFRKIGKIISLLTPGIVKNLKIWQFEVEKNEIETLQKLYKPYNEALEKQLNIKLPWQTVTDSRNKL